MVKKKRQQMFESHLEMAERHVLRSAQLLEAQAERVRRFERQGWSTRTAKALLFGMHKIHRRMLDHRDELRKKAYSPDRISTGQTVAPRLRPSAQIYAVVRTHVM